MKPTTKKKCAAVIPAICLFFLFITTFTTTLNADKIDVIEALIKKGKLDSAEDFCEKQTKTKVKQQCCMKLADAFIQLQNVEKSIFYCEEGKYKKGFNNVAAYYFDKGDIDNALNYYQKGLPDLKLSKVYEAKADALKKINPNDPQVKSYYDKATDVCKFFLKTFGYKWENSYFSVLKRCLDKRDALPKTPEEKAHDVELDKIMRKTATYCDRLEDSAFHFFCNEYIHEKIDHKYSMGGYYLHGDKTYTEKAYVYEYQLVKENDEINETRVLKKRGSFPVNEPDAKMETWGYHFEKLFFGPVALMGRSWFPYHHYRILKKEPLFGEEAVVIETIPTQYLKENYLFGKVWINTKTYSVMKIEWCPKSLKGMSWIPRFATDYELTPDVIFYAEFNTKKRGLCFPSRYCIDEGYITKKGKRFVRLKQEIKLKEYMFFTVGSEVLNEQGEPME